MDHDLERTAVGYVAASGRNDERALHELVAGADQPVDVFDLLDEVAVLAWELAVIVGQRSEPSRTPGEVLQAFALVRAGDGD